MSISLSDVMKGSQGTCFIFARHLVHSASDLANVTSTH